MHILRKHIQRSLPELIADIQRAISTREQELAKLGPSRSTLLQQRGFLLNISSAFDNIVQQAVNGMYRDEFFGSLNANNTPTDNNKLLRAAIRQLNDFFVEAMNIRGKRRTISTPSLFALELRFPEPVFDRENPYMVGWSPEYIECSKWEAEMRDLAGRNRGIELPGTANQILVGSMFRDQSGPWEQVAKDHLLRAWDSVRCFAYALLHHLTDEHSASLLATSVLEPS
jgi:hypothetical protein